MRREAAVVTCAVLLPPGTSLYADKSSNGKAWTVKNAIPFDVCSLDNIAPPSNCTDPGKSV